MSGLMIFQTILEILLVGFVFWGIFNEKKLIALEEKIACKIRRRAFKVNRGDNKCSKHCA